MGNRGKQEHSRGYHHDRANYRSCVNKYGIIVNWSRAWILNPKVSTGQMKVLEWIKEKYNLNTSDAIRKAIIDFTIANCNHHGINTIIVPDLLLYKLDKKSFDGYLPFTEPETGSKITFKINKEEYLKLKEIENQWNTDYKGAVRLTLERFMVKK